MVLYTYQTVDGKLDCHAYVTLKGEPLSQQDAQARGEQMQQENPQLGFMVLEAEDLPA